MPPNCTISTGEDGQLIEVSLSAEPHSRGNNPPGRGIFVPPSPADGEVTAAPSCGGISFTVRNAPLSETSIQVINEIRRGLCSHLVFRGKSIDEDVNDPSFRAG